MKREMITLMATALFATAAPVMAHEGYNHGASHQLSDAECARECDLLLKSCAQEVDSIQERIKKLQTAIKEKGASVYTVEELKVLNQKLKEADERLRALSKPGR